MSKYKTVCLLWEEVPDDTRIFILNIDAAAKAAGMTASELVRMLKEAHGSYVNGDENAATKQLNDFIYGSDGDDGCWGGLELDDCKPVEGPIDLVVISGICL